MCGLMMLGIEDLNSHRSDIHFDLGHSERKEFLYRTLYGPLKLKIDGFYSLCSNI